MTYKEIILKACQDKDAFLEAINQTNSYSDLCRYYGLPLYPQNAEFFRDWIKSQQIDISFWRRGKTKEVYSSIEKKCPQCGNPFTTKIGSTHEKQTCSHKCSNTYFKRHTLESCQKISDSNRKHRGLEPRSIIPVSKMCLICNQAFTSKVSKQRCCSAKCGGMLGRKIQRENAKPLSEESKEKMRQSALNRVKNGTHPGWGSRPRSLRSYPERFFEKVLNNHKVLFTAELKVGRYFIDFAMESKKIALEIDGQQHSLPERKEIDNRKDLYLTSQGWTVYRIPWREIRSLQGKEYIKQEIAKFLEFYSNMPIA